MSNPAGDIWIIMSRTGGDYEYTDWPIEWRQTEAEAGARIVELTAFIEALNQTVPPCPDVGEGPENDAQWETYIAREEAARVAAEAVGGALDATFYLVRLSSEAQPLGSEQRDEGNLPPAEPLDHLSGEGSRESGE